MLWLQVPFIFCLGFAIFGECWFWGCGVDFANGIWYTIDMTSRIIAHFYLAATIATTVYSQLIMKWRISGRFAGLKIPEGVWPKVVTLFMVLFDPFVFSGLVATFISGLCWMATMSKLEIGYAYPFTSLGFVLVVLLSGLLFGESLNAWRIWGVILIVAGITIASQGAK